MRYATRPNKPWAGISPLGMASETRALAGWIERRLAEEASTSTGYVLPIPDGGKVPDSLKTLLKALKGGLALIETTAQAGAKASRGAPL